MNCAVQVPRSLKVLSATFIDYIRLAIEDVNSENLQSNDEISLSFDRLIPKK